ncbi:hypothetical protein CKAH01_15068 [Colletotrichum kahawae]|uniref:Uncharacterized protein n=1 Tax=Colletotrichum kahawae TaxID=34407 RepID=A0AAD9YKF4_COLKA|nr:hypothetical protein CKAH01_15068 [Colletotrichum kahawae]
MGWEGPSQIELSSWWSAKPEGARTKPNLHPCFPLISQPILALVMRPAPQRALSGQYRDHIRRSWHLATPRHVGHRLQARIPSQGHTRQQSLPRPGFLIRRRGRGRPGCARLHPGASTRYQAAVRRLARDSDMYMREVWSAGVALVWMYCVDGPGVRVAHKAPANKG